jgi:hypothetical protein
MNMYITPDQNTVVIWADENPPRQLEFKPSHTETCRTCSVSSTFCSRLVCRFASVFAPCMPHNRRDNRNGVFVSRGAA